MTADASSEVRFLTRSMRASDEAFTFSSFLEWMRDSDATANIYDRHVYRVFKDQWASVLRDFDVIVAYPDGDEDEIAGYIASKGKTLAFLYVKLVPWRRLGVANLLLRQAGFEKGDEVVMLYGSSRAVDLARSKGWSVTVAPGAAQAVKVMLGVV